MKNNMLFLIIFASLFVSLQASSYDTYVDKLQKERDRVSDNRDFKAEGRRLNNDFDKLTSRRDLINKARDTRASIRKEMSRVF